MSSVQTKMSQHIQVVLCTFLHPTWWEGMCCICWSICGYWWCYCSIQSKSSDHYMYPSWVCLCINFGGSIWYSLFVLIWCWLHCCLSFISIPREIPEISVLSQMHMDEYCVYCFLFLFVLLSFSSSILLVVDCCGLLWTAVVRTDTIPSTIVVRIDTIPASNCYSSRHPSCIV